MAPFVIYPDPRMQQAAAPRPVDHAMRDAGNQLLDAAQAAQAYGLAAAHLGLVEPVIVVSVSADTAQRDYRVFFNPRIVSHADQRQFGPEGSVSMPGIEVPIERSTGIELAFCDADNLEQSLVFEGFVARVVQHEVDQLNGIFFLSRLSRLKRDTAIRKFEKSRR